MSQHVEPRCRHELPQRAQVDLNHHHLVDHHPHHHHHHHYYQNRLSPPSTLSAPEQGPGSPRAPTASSTSSFSAAAAAAAAAAGPDSQFAAPAHAARRPILASSLASSSPSLSSPKSPATHLATTSAPPPSSCASIASSSSLPSFVPSQQLAVHGNLPTGRLIPVPPLSSAASLPHLTSPRTPRAAISSPFSTANTSALPRTSFSNRNTNVQDTRLGPPRDSPAPSVPAAPASNAPAMAAPVAAGLVEAPKPSPRDSSADIVPSTIPPASPSEKGQARNDHQKAPDIASLIKAAGSPEVVIQHLLKEKQSQQQQNAQLWRLVDKQRAMILGLNKDLEQALKEKEKYRKKLKDVMSNPAMLKAEGAPPGEAGADGRRGTTLAPVDVQVAKAQPSTTPDSPTLESDSQRTSPVEVTMAPYPITPPADRPQEPKSAVEELLDPEHSMPKPSEHAVGKFDHEAVETAAEEERKAKSEEQLKEIPYNITLPPSRSLPSEPPKMPPPKPPTSAPPSVLAFDTTPPSDEGIASFPSPPRKPPPAPLRLKPKGRRDQVPAEEDDTDSDLDNILEVDEITDVKRGRRRTREEDQRQRGATSLKGIRDAADAKKNGPIKATSSPPERSTPTTIRVTEVDMPASIDSTLHSASARELVAPRPSPGLPLSPRPTSKVKPGTLSPVIGSRTVSAPLSSRPPQQALPLPPTAQQTTPVTTSPATISPAQPHSGAKRTGETFPPLASAKTRTSSLERVQIYKGLVTEEYPDLLLPPNAVPSIQIKVASSRMKPSRASLLSLTQLEEDPVFTLAIISRADRGELWRVEKDIVSFAKLDQRLKQCSTFTAKTPERSLFSGHAPAKLDARRVALEQYMEELLDTPLDTATALELCRYLSTNTLPPNADETGTPAKPTPEKSGHAPGSDGRPTRSGYLTKKGKNFGGWKARFFIIDGPQLKYYETPGGTHLGSIKLQNAQIGRQSQSNESLSSVPGSNGDDLDNQYRHAFLILEPKKKDSSSHVKHVLCAENDKERDLWVDVLLQWIDYRAPGDVEHQGPRPSAQDRHTIMVDSYGAPRNKRMTQGRASHHPADSDPLIGVRYDSVQAGDVPQGAPGGLRASASATEQHPLQIGETMSSQPKHMISGPKDPQVISDSSAWGNKHSIPSMEDKKAKKRSFFGFGPKTRSSSDGQDSLFGGSEAGSSTPPPNTYNGLSRQVFGAPLAEAVRFCPPSDINVPLPCVVYRCVEYLANKNAIREEGIFRLSGSNVVIKQLRERFNTEGDVNLLTDEQYYDIHAVASLLKLYLRELPTTILTRDLQREFVISTELPDKAEKVSMLSELAKRLPQANATLLKYLISFLIKIINNADVNKMNVRNVGIVFAPTLNIPAPVFALFLQHYESIFGIDPEQYEPPCTVTDAEPSRKGRFDARPRSEMPMRTSTSSGSASPQSRSRKESRRENPRSTPTPPLMQVTRGSPTPPLAAARPPFDSVQNPKRSSAAVVSSRPAYESGYGIPGGSDSYNHLPSQRPPPGYERPMFPTGGTEKTADAPQTAAAKRRESSIYMGGPVGLQHSGSKSRLREEAKF
ncbi:hypothetical protein HIM_02487 [Hirsutella minnesotensis 3608]|nr:hypothetical protein HIM_02487 [Hirsutella minnesotensis 3608]